MKTTSLYALAAAGIVLGGMAFASTPVKAADLGGGSDLEERVAELEATTVRKGNRKVSLELYGQVNRALLYWQDGKDSDSYIVDANNSSTRLGVKGEGQIAAGWKSGFNIEFDFTDSASNSVSNSKLNVGGDQGKGETGPIGLRQGFWYIDSDRMGRISLGQQSSATDDLTIINLSGAGIASDGRSLWNNNFDVRRSTVAGTAVTKWGRIADGLDTDRGNFVRYDSPSLAGFILSTAWGENDQWDAAVRYKGEFGGIRLAGGIGYYYTGNTAGKDANTNWGSQAGFANQANTTREEVKGSISAMHVPTGIYVAFSAGERFNQDVVNDGGGKSGEHYKDATFWYLQGGVDRRFFPVGNTTLYGEYGNYNNFGVTSVETYQSDGYRAGKLSGADVDRWGLGVVQKFDSAAVEVYASYQHWTADLSQYSGAGTVAAPTEDFDAVIVGSRIKF